MPVAENIASIRQRIAQSARQASRNPDDISLMAVTKTVAAAAIEEAYQAGMRLFGESRVQEFEKKAEGLRNLHDAQWHMIGHLQSNKAARAAELFSFFDSVDSIRLAEKLHASAERLHKKLSVLLEINIGGEAAKSGFPPQSPELEAMLQAAPQFPHLEIRGLMTVPPYTEDPEGSRPFFRALRELRDRIAASRYERIEMEILSTGMSHDFEVAIEEGATCVRVGTAIFGERLRR